MVQIKVSEDLADTLKWKLREIETERKYLLDSLCEIIKVMYQPDFMEGTYSMGELFPLWQLADYKRLLDELEKAIAQWVKYYNERRFHESLDNLTPRDVYLGQGEEIKRIRETIKQNSINKRIFDNKTMKYQRK